jgi:very-short-patch-repair endonuclease
MNLPFEILRLGGLAPTYALLRRGATSHGLTAAVRRGEIERVRQGWYGLPAADPLSTQAARIGGRLTCVSGARHHELWVAASDRIHVRVPYNASRLRTPHNARQRLDLARDRHVTVHWGPPDVPGTRFAMLPRECLRDMVWCQSPERVVAAVDSALRAGKITLTQWMRDIRSFPRKLRRLLAMVDARSESIIESLMRFRLRQRGYSPEVQAQISGVGRVDLRIGRLVIELDGWEFHQTREQFEEDRKRDALLAAKGYRVLRFTYRQLTRRWHEVLAAVEAALR